jgi:hypothetical protein
MGLWFFKDKWEVAPFANRIKDKDFYLVCGGPSLKEVPPESLRVPNALLVVMNNAYPYIRPDIWVGMDHPHCYPRQVLWEPFMKIMRGGYQHKTSEGRAIRDKFNLFFADCSKFEDPHSEIFKPPTDSTVFIWKKNVMTITMHILIWMGAKRINIVGCDLSGEHGDYHSDEVNLSKVNKTWNRKTYNEINKFLKKIVPMAKKNGVEINSCTPDSRINEYMNYIPLEAALKKTQESVPFGGHLYHSSKVEE